MRIWSLHPRHLDAKGLVALWREGLLALHVLKGRTRGYKNHPQLDRFKEQEDPVASIEAYLHIVCDEADARGYSFSREKLSPRQEVKPIPVTTGQLLYEHTHLEQKLRVRSPEDLLRLEALKEHPLFTIQKGDVESWERI